MAERNLITTIEGPKGSAEVYEVTEGSLPSSLADLVSGDDPAAFLPDPEKGIQLDPWGNPFVFKVGDGDYTLFSMGPNGLDGGGDDVELD